jgi:hypothetical protein
VVSSKFIMDLAEDIRMKKILLMGIVLTMALSIPSVSQEYPHLRRVEVRASVALGGNNHFYYFTYAVTNGVTSLGGIEEFEVDISRKPGTADIDTVGLQFENDGFIEGSFRRHFPFLRGRITPVGLVASPGQSFGFTWTGGFSNDLTALWGADSALIEPGQSLSGFELMSKGLPGIRRCIVSPYFDVDSLFPDLDDPDRTLSIAQMDSIREAVKFFGWTVGPTAPPIDLVPTVWLDTLSSYTSQSLSLGWITSQAVTDKYISYFSSGRAKLVQQDSVGARTVLQQVLRDVDIDSTTNLTSEAYALLRYNTEYLLSQLPAGQEGIAPYSLFATHSMWLRENSKVYSGSIGVDSVGLPPFLDSQVELSVGQRVMIASGSSVKAHRIKVKQGAVVNGDVYYNELDNNGTITGSQHTPLSLPLVASLPEFKVSTPGTQNITVAQNSNRTLPPGSYGDIEIKKNGRLILTGGTYHLKSITAGEDTRILVQSASEIRIADKFSSGEGSYIGPEDTTTLRANEIVFYVGGINGKTGTLGADPKAAKIGMRNTVKAMFYVPNGTLWIREGSEVEGTFVGKDVEVGIGVKVWWKSGF